MPEKVTRHSLQRAITAARRGLFIQSTLECWLHIAPWLLAPALLLTVIDQYWFAGQWTILIMVITIATSLAIPLVRAGWLLALPFRSALAIDERTHLKDRLSSAWEFLEQEEVDAPTQAQISDALAHAKALHVGNLLNPNIVQKCRLPIALVALFLLSFLIPARGSVAPDPVESARLAEQIDILQELEDAFEEEDITDVELAEIVEELRKVKSEFDTGDLNERDLMIALSRLEDALESATADEGVTSLARELDALTPQLASASATEALAEALKGKELEEAAEEMESLGERVGELSEEELKSLAEAMESAAKAVANSKSANSGNEFIEGQENNNNSGQQSQSFESDLSKAAESLRSSQNQQFKQSSQSMASKMQRIQKLIESQQMREQLAMARARLGQAGQEGEKGMGRGEESGDGESEGMGEGGQNGRQSRTDNPGNGGLEAGTAPAGDNRGEADRLGDTAGELLRLTGQAGEGEVRTETETTAGQTGDATQTAKEILSSYEAIAEEVISREEVPLGHRLHVKRYFQEIRPEE